MADLVNFNLPTPFSQEQAKIAQQQKLADMLQQQAFSAPERFSYNGIEAPISPLTGLNKLAQGLISGYMQNKALDSQNAISQKYLGQAQDWAKALEGTTTPGQPAVQFKPTAADTADQQMVPGQENKQIPVDAQGMATQAATPDTVTPRNKAEQLAYLMQGMGNPYSAPMAGSMYAQSIKETKLAPGEAVFDSTGNRKFGLDPKADFGTTLQNVTKDPRSSTGWVATIIDKNTGQPKIIETQAPTNQYTAPTVEGNLNRTQTREISDRAFNNLSAEQKADYNLRAARLGQTGAELYFNTGIQAPGMPSGVSPSAPGAGAPPIPTPGSVAPVAPSPVPSVPAAPVAAPTGVPVPPAPGLTPKDQAAQNAKLSGEQLENRQQLPAVIAQGENQVKQLDDLLGHKGLPDYVGAVTGGVRAMIPGTDAADFKSRLDQVHAGAFMQAYQKLRGGGAITEIEGKKATDSITRMQQAQSPAEFKKAAQEYRDVIQKGVARAKTLAGVTEDHPPLPPGFVVQ